jgi:hypothetical protein
MKKISIYIFLACVSLLWVGCQEDPEPGGTATQDVAGEWWVTVFTDDGSGILEDYSGGYVKVSTFNTSSNTADSLWIYDNDHIWEFQVKAAYDKNAKTFSVTDGQNVSYDSKVTITDGQVFLGQGLSSSGVKTDSIYFTATFDDDTDALLYIVSGHRRTGFLEDEHE